MKRSVHAESRDGLLDSKHLPVFDASVPSLTPAVASYLPGRSAGCRPWMAVGRQSGVGLIEVLVAVLVLSIGFLGVAALQAMSMSTNNGAMAKSMATIASYSVLDAIRVDKPNATSYNGTVAANACPATAGNLASDQIHNWCVQLGKTLGPLATTKGTINCTAVGNDFNCGVTISFNDSRAGVGAANQTITTQAIL